MQPTSLLPGITARAQVERVTAALPRAAPEQVPKAAPAKAPVAALGAAGEPDDCEECLDN